MQHKKCSKKLLLLISLALTIILCIHCRKPYGHIAADDIHSMVFYYDGYIGYEGVNGEKIKTEDFAFCVQPLNNIKTFGISKEPSEPLEGGYRKGFDITLKNGRLLSIYNANGTQIIVNGHWYSANRRSIAEFELCYDEMRLKYFPNHKDRKYFERDLQCLKEWLKQN